MKTALLIFAILLMILSPAHGVVRFYKRAELIEKADVIAIIELKEPEPAKAPHGFQSDDPFAESDYPVRAPRWSYMAQSSATVVTTLKGTIPKTFTLYGDEVFFCGQCKLAKGKYLAFLTKDGSLQVGLNWKMSLRPIVGDKVEWYVTQDPYSLEYQPLEEVIAEVKAKAAIKIPVEEKH